MVQPIIIGVGQKIFRPETVDQFVHPFESMKQAVLTAAEDAHLADLSSAVDAVHVVNMFSWTPKDAPSSLSEALGVQPTIKEYTAIGGNSPQWLVNRVADNLSAGKCQLAVLAGCEVMHSLRMAGRAGVDLGAFKESVGVPMVGIDKNGTLDVEMAHGADLPVRIYPMLEIALRAKEGLTVEQHRLRLGRWGAEFSAVAAKNPYAWFPIARTADEITQPTGKNRMLGFPYTRLVNSELYVDQSAAVLMTTPEVARRLGVPEDRWIYLHGGQDAHDHWYVSHRPDLATSPAVKACVDDALAQAGKSLDQIDMFDLYSCFSVMPFLTQHMLGIPDSDPRPRTLTGGLPFFGGPGNNYVMHSIAEAVQHCRADRGKFAMVTANGYYATKHGVGIYSSHEPTRDWKRTDPGTFQEQLPLAKPLEVDLKPEGPLTVEAYTVWHDRQGAPEYGIVCGRMASGQRAWARPTGGAEVLQAMMASEWVGEVGRVTGQQGGVNQIDFA